MCLNQSPSHLCYFLLLGLNNLKKKKLFSTAKPSFVLRQLIHICTDGKPSGHSLSSLRRQLERLVGKMCA